VAQYFLQNLRTDEAIEFGEDFESEIFTRYWWPSMIGVFY
jgi:hypothetical protein